MEKENYLPTIESLIKKFVGKDMPIVSTKDIGHGTDSKAVIIGREIEIYS